MPESSAHDRVEVHVKSLVTNEKTTFSWSSGATVAKTWDEAYLELKEGRRDGDTFRCADGTDLMPLLNLTLNELRERKVCQGEHFEIRGPSGGA
jgi:hypothetical protein